MKSRMNLLSEALQEKQRARRALRRWRQVCFILILGLAAWTCLEYRNLNALAVERDALERQFAPIKYAKSNIKRISQKCEQLRSKEQFAIALSNDTPALHILQAIESAAARCQGELFLQEVVYLGLSGRVNAATSSRPPSTLLLRGLGENNLAIAKFAAALRDSGLFSGVALAASESQELDGKAVQAFELNCTLITTGAGP